MKILSGAYQKTTGQILFEGQEVQIKNPMHAQQLGISTIYQELNLIPHLTVGENIYPGREPRLFSGVHIATPGHSRSGICRVGSSACFLLFNIV